MARRLVRACLGAVGRPRNALGGGGAHDFLGAPSAGGDATKLLLALATNLDAVVLDEVRRPLLASPRRGP